MVCCKVMEASASKAVERAMNEGRQKERLNRERAGFPASASSLPFTYLVCRFMEAFIWESHSENGEALL